MSAETSRLLIWLSDTERKAVADMATALRASGAGTATLTARADVGEAADYSLSQPGLSLAMLAE